MPNLRYTFFGAPRLERDGSPVEVDTRKAIALLAYLAVTGQPQRRDTLAALLWPEYSQSRARAGLRRTLSSLNKALNGEGLIIEREEVSLDRSAGAEIDVQQFRALLEQVQGPPAPWRPALPGLHPPAAQGRRPGPGRFHGRIYSSRQRRIRRLAVPEL